jgi:amino acid transporter
VRFSAPVGLSSSRSGRSCLFGYLSGQFVSAPRLTFAFAEQRDFPAAFAAVHDRFRTPHISILVYAVLVWTLAI